MLKDMTKREQDMYERGKEDGYEKGYEIGLQEGYDNGYDEGNSEGFDEGQKYEIENYENKVDEGYLAYTNLKDNIYTLLRDLRVENDIKRSEEIEEIIHRISKVVIV